MLDVIVIGGGPAGIAAAVYARRKGLQVRLISPDLGGKTNYRLQMPHLDWPLVIPGEDLLHQLTGDMERLGCERQADVATRIEPAAVGYAVHTRQGPVEKARAVIIASGAHVQRLDVPGEAEFLMRGLAYSALTYAPQFVDQTAVVVGDSARALRATAELARTARKVTLIAPGELSGPLARKLLATPNVVVWPGYQVLHVNGDRHARSLTISKNGLIHEVVADGFFVELGLRPNVAFAAGLVIQEEWGAIRVDCRCRTSAPGVFAAGDVTGIGIEQVLIALGEGAKAALAAFDYLLELPEEEMATPMNEEWR